MVMPGPLKNQIVWVRLPDDSAPFSQDGFIDPSPGKNAPHLEVYTAQISTTPFPVNGQLPPEGLSSLHELALETDRYVGLDSQWYKNDTALSCGSPSSIT
jgi:hypothetical protein